MRAFAFLIAVSCFSLPCHAELPPYAPVVEMHADVSGRVHAGQFEGLLQDADRFQKSQERFADGRWKLAVFYRGLREGFSNNATSEADWNRYQSQVAGLTKRHPQSSNAWLMLATLHDSHAWAVRGGGYSKTVGDTVAARFADLLEQSREVLNRHQATLSANPQWYAERIAVGGSAGDDAKELDAIFEEGVRKEPGYQQTWFNRLHFLTPKWGGNIAQMVGFIAHANRYPAGPDGSGMTARLLWFAEGDGYWDLVRQPSIDWPIVKQSYEDVLARYPAEFNAQHFFMEACGKSDKAAAARLLARVTPAPTPDQLGDNARIYQLCTDWATGRIKEFAMRDHETGQVTFIH